MRLRTLRRGSTVYHGTSAPEDFDIPDGPAWFSDSRSVAEYFVKWHEGPKIRDVARYFVDPRERPKAPPRILEYRLLSSVKLLLIESRLDFERALDYEAADDPVELAEQICGQYDGWIIPTNYPEGADILICDPSRYLRLVGMTELD